MTPKQLKELNKLLKELSEMQDIARGIDDRLFAIAMKVWRMTMDRGVG